MHAGVPWSLGERVGQVTAASNVAAVTWRLYRVGVQVVDGKVAAAARSQRAGSVLSTVGTTTGAAERSGGDMAAKGRAVVWILGLFVFIAVVATGGGALAALTFSTALYLLVFLVSTAFAAWERLHRRVDRDDT